jgi:hypothetical protein
MFSIAVDGAQRRMAKIKNGELLHGHGQTLALGAA